MISSLRGRTLAQNSSHLNRGRYPPAPQHRSRPCLAGTTTFAKRENPPPPTSKKRHPSSMRPLFCLVVRERVTILRHATNRGMPVLLYYSVRYYMIQGVCTPGVLVFFFWGCVAPPQRRVLEPHYNAPPSPLPPPLPFAVLLTARTVGATAGFPAL